MQTRRGSDHDPHSKGTSGLGGKKFSANKLLRSAGNSTEKRLSPEGDKKKNIKKAKEQYVSITILTYHPKKPKI